VITVSVKSVIVDVAFHAVPCFLYGAVLMVYYLQCVSASLDIKLILENLNII
jgi:hypothetical protein